jgi:hypothetical protein
MILQRTEMITSLFSRCRSQGAPCRPRLRIQFSYSSLVSKSAWIINRQMGNGIRTRFCKEITIAAHGFRPIWISVQVSASTERIRTQHFQLFFAWALPPYGLSLPLRRLRCLPRRIQEAFGITARLALLIWRTRRYHLRRLA